MDSLINAAARSLALGDPLMALKRVVAARCVSGSKHLQEMSKQLQLEFFPAIVSI